MSNPKNFAKLLDCFKTGNSSLFLFVEEHKKAETSTERAQNCHEIIANRTRESNSESIKDMSVMKKQLEAAEKEEREQTIKEAFRIFDKDDDGYLDGVEMRRLLNRFRITYTDEEVDDISCTSNTSGTFKDTCKVTCNNPCK